MTDTEKELIHWVLNCGPWAPNATDKLSGFRSRILAERIHPAAKEAWIAHRAAYLKEQRASSKRIDDARWALVREHRELEPFALTGPSQWEIEANERSRRDE